MCFLLFFCCVTPIECSKVSLLCQSLSNIDFQDKEAEELGKRFLVKKLAFLKACFLRQIGRITAKNLDINEFLLKFQVYSTSMLASGVS